MLGTAGVINVSYHVDTKRSAELEAARRSKAIRLVATFLGRQCLTASSVPARMMGSCLVIALIAGSRH
jgi:hypothetical protein